MMNPIKYFILIILIMFISKNAISQYDAMELSCYINKRPYTEFSNLIHSNDTIVFKLKCEDKIDDYRFGDLLISLNTYRGARAFFNELKIVDTLTFNNQSYEPTIKIPMTNYIRKWNSKSRNDNRLYINILGIFIKSDDKLLNIEHPYYKLEFEFIISGD